jgi:hypothetical protein
MSATMRAARMRSAGFFGSNDSLVSPSPTFRSATSPAVCGQAAVHAAARSSRAHLHPQLPEHVLPVAVRAPAPERIAPGVLDQLAVAGGQQLAAHVLVLGDLGAQDVAHDVHLDSSQSGGGRCLLRSAILKASCAEGAD